MSFNQQDFLTVGIPYRLANLELFERATEIVLSRPDPIDVRVVFAMGHEMRGPYWIVTNSMMELGLLTCRVLLDFLVTPRKRDGDVTIDMFTRPDGKPLDRPTINQVASCYHGGGTVGDVIDAIAFTKQAAHKGVAHLTVGRREEDDELFRYLVATQAIRSGVIKFLYEELGRAPPRPIIKDLRRSDLL
jgi:hypothetical protein